MLTEEEIKDTGQMIKSRWPWLFFAVPLSEFHASLQASLVWHSLREDLSDLII